MGTVEAQQEIQTLIDGLYPCIYVTTEDQRLALKAIEQVAEEAIFQPFQVLTFDMGTLINETTKQRYREKYTRLQGSPDNPSILDFIENYDKGNAIFVLFDYHDVLKNENGQIWFKTLIDKIRVPCDSSFVFSHYRIGGNPKNGLIKKHIIILSSVLTIPPFLEKCMALVNFGLPERREIENMLKTLLEKSELNSHLPEKKRNQIIDACVGLTESEIINTFSRSMAENEGHLVPETILKEKKQAVQKNGALQYYEPNIQLEDIGGLHQLIDWIKKRKLAFDAAVRSQFGLAYPKGILLTGIQGCGKSYTAKAVASFLGMPLLRLDIGTLMNKWIGESESNGRKALELAEAISPCVLWIDEIEKNMSAGSQAHEVTTRILSLLLTWLQEKTEPVFVIATANNITQMPPELFRKGRFDEIFFVDLPNGQERAEIFYIHLQKQINCDVEMFDLAKLAAQTSGYSGSEIEALINEAVFSAASEGKYLEQEYILREIFKTPPLSETNAEQVAAIHDWAAKHHVRLAN